MPRNLNATELKRLHREWRHEERPRLALMLDQVAGPYNIGAMLRTAAALKVDYMVSVSSETRWTDVKVQKTALGTHRFLELDHFETAEEAAKAVKAKGFSIVGIELATDAEPLWDVDLNRDVCLVMGHEDRGLSNDMFKYCEELAFIPLMGKVGSLNVATAASMAIYEARRQAVAAVEG